MSVSVSVFEFGEGGERGRGGCCVVANADRLCAMLTRLAGLDRLNPLIPHALHPRKPTTANREPPSNTNSNTLTLTRALWLRDVMNSQGGRGEGTGERYQGLGMRNVLLIIPLPCRT